MWKWLLPFFFYNSSNMSSVQFIEIHAHRGAYDRPENSIAAFTRAAELGADRVELDLQVTADGWIVVAHDPWLRERVCRSDRGKVVEEKIYFRTLILWETRRYLCEGEPIPTLREVFAALKNVKTRRGLPMGINIEVKFYPDHPEWFPTREEYMKTLAQEIVQSGYTQARLMVQSFDAGVLAQLRKLNAALTLALLVDQPKDAAKTAQEIGAQIVAPQFAKLTKADVDQLHARGLKVIPWTVNQPEDIRRILALGVDGLITDRPDLALQLP